MEYQSEEENDYTEVIDNLVHMFGNVLNKDAICTVVESCGGDLNISIDTIMDITSEGNIINKDDSSQNEDNTTVDNVEAVNTPNTMLPTISYASAAQTSNNPSTGVIAKEILKPIKPIKTVQPVWTDQIRHIITHHNQGNRTMIIMRGLPGSGKSYLAKQLIDMTIGSNTINYKSHIFSTDDYFIAHGQFQFDKYRLSEAHLWNHNRVRDAAVQGLSPIIVDNTNIEIWEMEPYAKFAIANGYIIEVVEPNTPWARKPFQLFKRNVHSVPLVTIKRKLEMFNESVTGDSLKSTFGLSYPAEKVPPVKRTIPMIIIEHNDTIISGTVSKDAKIADRGNAQQNWNASSSSTSNQKTNEHEALSIVKHTVEENLGANNETVRFENSPNNEEGAEEKRNQKLLAAEKLLEEMEKVEQEWENGAQWDEPVQQTRPIIKSSTKSISDEMLNLNIESKPPRQLDVAESKKSADTLMKTVNDCQDWSQISMFMPPWSLPSDSANSVPNYEIAVVTKSNGTCMELGDTDVNGSKKLLVATPRNINEFYMPLNKEKIPEKRMLDKSIMTNEDFLPNQFRCSNEEKHFIAFCKLFKTIARTDLRDIFDKCCGDVNWAVEIVLDGMVNKQFKTVDAEEINDDEDESLEQCQCLATYNVIPDVETTNNASSITAQAKENVLDGDEDRADNAQQPQKKKREAISGENLEIKRQIEKNFVISDNHYSEHCLKIRKLRRGENTTPDIAEQPSTSTGIYSTCPIIDSHVAPDRDDDDLSDDDYSNESEADDNDKIVSVRLGWDCIKDLDRMFGRKDMQYPENVMPKISIPLCVLNQINALWMESLMYQLETAAKESAEMIKRDEEFAREIAMKEAELNLAGKEPAIPDFKEIMDMDLALSIYQKDVAEWRNNMPTDLAAKMTRDKLYNLFPDVDKDTLTELLMAHDNNFKATVEVLLMSTGRSDVLETENGVNKFVMEKEMKRQEKILEERRKELSETDWPLLNKGEHCDMSTVNAYRKEAEQHLQRSNTSRQKAQDYIRRGMPQVATYYSEIAQFHRQKYDHSNGLAVSALMQYHAMNSPDSLTIDLHYLHVNEAMASLDVFLDTHIQKLRESSQNSTTLFIITGRGNNSPGRPRIKPATKRRLDQRGLCFAEGNPGLLNAMVCNNSKLAYQIEVP